MKPGITEFTPDFFDTSSAAWRANKVPIGEGSFRYKKDAFTEAAAAAAPRRSARLVAAAAAATAQPKPTVEKKYWLRSSKHGGGQDTKTKTL